MHLELEKSLQITYGKMYRGLEKISSLRKKSRLKKKERKIKVLKNYLSFLLSLILYNRIYPFSGRYEEKKSEHPEEKMNGVENC